MNAEGRLEENNKILTEHLELQKHTVKIQNKYIERLENEILELKILNTVESKKVLRSKHLKIV